MATTKDVETPTSLCCDIKNPQAKIVPIVEDVTTPKLDIRLSLQHSARRLLLLFLLDLLFSRSEQPEQPVVEDDDDNDDDDDDDDKDKDDAEDSFLSFVIDIGATAMNQNPGTFKSRMFIFYIVCSVSSLHDVDGTGRSKQSRSEKKSQKAMLKLGMKSIPGVSRVTIKKGKN
ncbi:hypothetical protein Godav_015162, partial [Gossypium davidsonii]|nr:hypothetical protein [Gossypium davidsonii]